MIAVQRKRKTVALCHTSAACKIVQSHNHISRHVGQHVGSCKAFATCCYCKVTSHSPRGVELGSRTGQVGAGSNDNFDHNMQQQLLKTPYSSHLIVGLSSVQGTTISKNSIARGTAVGYKGKAIPHCPFIQLLHISISKEKHGSNPYRPMWQTHTSRARL
jgi:hypothetical protein